MLHAIVLGPVRHCIQFLNGQGIHVGPHCDRWAGAGSFEKSDDARMRDTRLNREAKPLEMLSDNARRAKLAVAEFGMLVEVTANLYKSWLQRCSNRLNVRIGHF
jgi:hypothetical protein